MNTVNIMTEVTITEKKKEFLISAVYFLTIAAIVYLIFKYAIFIVMPFLIGFAIAALLSPLVRFLSSRFDMKRKPCAILILLLFLATIGMLLTITVVRVAVWIGEFSSALPSLYSETIEPALGWMFEWINNVIARFEFYTGSGFASSLSELFASIRASLGTAVSDISVKALTRLSAFAAGIPRFIIELLFAVIASFFFIVDFEELIAFIKSRLPKKAVGIMTELRDKFFMTIARYVRSYALIMLITFAELSVGLFLIGIENPLLYALVIALFDVLPVLGSGGVLIPWGIFELFRGKLGIGIGLLVVWGVITVVRNIIEPRILGRQVGLHPLLTLAAMFVGTKLFGILGLFLLPIGLSIAFSVMRERDQSLKEK